MNNRISKQQIEEWIESPVTLALKSLAERELAACHESFGIDSYYLHEPQKTQETLAHLNGAMGIWEYVIEALNGEGWDEDE